MGFNYCRLRIAAHFCDAVHPACGAAAYLATARDARWSARHSAVLVRVRLGTCWAVGAASSFVLKFRLRQSYGCHEEH